MKVWKIIVIGGAVYLGGRYLFSLKRAEQKVVITVSAKKDQITTQGLSLLLSYNIKNPTAANMRMTPPLIRLSVEGKQIATSNMQLVDIPEAYRTADNKISIRAYEETGEISTRLMVPWVGLLALGGDLLTRFQSSAEKDKLDVKIETLAQVFTLVGSFPYETTTTLKV